MPLKNKSMTSLGIERGSTRIKAVLAGPDGSVLASGAHDWENHFEGGYWTYPLEEVWSGIQDAYHNLAEDYRNTYGEPLTTVGALDYDAAMMASFDELLDEAKLPTICGTCCPRCFAPGRTLGP